ncbi:GNAT family N-acetyltransferase [Acinetobacter sp. LoGeW2-3]|uniref:GNAT family N-acetyltransferase n=1 Tax=Acinetobacter sp. LoGeW2-3 TaxID=1808001 RepID=UPI000C058204|nr:GNAT family N-acetyltransferase [Acinetobacter sp. LoGeW2-3]ATO19775.1 GNAT family N-acetyltransferase [Acinetobacter sp. LoGeW2-3]
MIREGKVQDIPQIVHVVHDSIRTCVLDHQREEPRIQTWLEAFTHSTLIVEMLYNDCWVYTVHDRVVGFLMVSDQGEIRMHYVSSGMQRMGYGTQLFYHMLDALTPKKIDRLEIETTRTALPYYTKLGFQNTSLQMQDEPALRLFKALPSSTYSQF